MTTVFETIRLLAGEPGFEPGLADPESAVLPLDDSPAPLHHTTKSYARKTLVSGFGFLHRVRQWQAGYATAARAWG